LTQLRTIVQLDLAGDSRRGLGLGGGFPPSVVIKARWRAGSEAARGVFQLVSRPVFCSDVINLQIFMIIKCNCNHCSTHLEFDSHDAGRVITCPSCSMETTLYVPPPAPVAKPKSEPPKKKVSASWFAQFKQDVFGEEPEPPKIEVPAKINTPQNSKGMPASAVLLTISSVVLFVIGCGLVFDGCNSEVNEEAKPDGSAIRQTVFALQYGFGFVTIALSLILGALCRLIRFNRE